MAAASAATSRMWGALDMSTTWRPLREGDVFRRLDGGTFWVQYVNSSGAHVVPLKSSVRQIGEQTINFVGGGTTISANAVVQILHPLELGGNSQEYANYVKLEEKSGRRASSMARTKNAKGAAFGDFVDVPLTEVEVAANMADGSAEPETDQQETAGMAKKAAAKKAKTNGAAKREKTPKKVRKCVCNCGTETTGYFAPGHDARFHGWIKKLASGKMGPNEIPAPVRKGLDLVQTKDGYKAKSPEYYKVD